MADSALHVRYRPFLRFRSERVALYDPTIEVPFVLADAFANETCREPGLGLGAAERSAGDALPLLRGELRDLEAVGGLSEWAVEPAREWCARA